MDSSRDDETVKLLREIRDLQKAHFERYVEFTTRVLDQQRTALRQAKDDNDEALDNQRDSIRMARRAEIMVPVLAVMIGVMVAGCVVALCLFVLRP